MFHCALKSFYCVLGAQECVIHCAQVVSGGMGWLNSKESSKLKIKSKKINPDIIVHMMENLRPKIEKANRDGLFSLLKR